MNLCIPARPLLFVLLALSTFPVLNCSAESVPGLSLKIGVLLPPEEPQGASIREGALLAQERSNQSSETKVDVIFRGRVGQWGADAQEAARMVIDDNVACLVAPPDGAASHLVLQVSGRTGVPVVSLCPDSLVSRTGVPWMLRVVPCTADEGKALFTGMPLVNSRKPRHWVAVVPDGRAGRELSRDLKQAATSCQLQLDAILEVPATPTNFNDIRAQVLRHRPDVVLLWLAPVASGTMAKSFRAGGFHGALAGPSGLRCVEFTDAAQDALEGFLVPGIGINTAGTARFLSFRTAYKQRWARDPGLLAAMSYDAVLALLRLRQIDPRSPAHRPPADFSVAGVTGDLTFDAEGNRQVVLNLLQGHDRGFIGLGGIH